ncbi:Phosphatidylglycerol/phosphatidylinositol transfer protein, partial [Allomyces javanicus]
MTSASPTLLITLMLLVAVSAPTLAAPSIHTVSHDSELPLQSAVQPHVALRRVAKYIDAQSIESCGGDHDQFQVLSARIIPDPPVAGQKAVVEIDGFLLKPLDQGSYVEMTVKVGTIKLLAKTYDFCNEAWLHPGLPCPIATGHQVIRVDMELPKEVPPAIFNIHALVYDVEDNDVACLSAKVDMR